MKQLLILSVLLCIGGAAIGQDISAIGQSKELFEAGDYAGGVKLLKSSFRDRSLSGQQRCDILRSLAEFYETSAGDYGQALNYYQQILRSNLAMNDTAKSQARENIMRLEMLGQKYVTQNALLEMIKRSQGRQDHNKVREQIGQLQDIFREDPDYYRVGEVYYYLGMSYLTLDMYADAKASLDKAVVLKPGMDFYLPVKSNLEIASRKLKDSRTNAWAWGIIGVCLIVIAVVFYASRPWQWVKVKHLAGGVTLLVAWGLTFYVCIQLSGLRIENNNTQVEIEVEQPTFIKATLPNPGASIAMQLFFYGVVGVVGVYVLAIGFGRFKNRLVAGVLTFLGGLIFSSSLCAVFYMRHVSDKSQFYPPADKVMSYAQGISYFKVRGMKPYVLTNPKAYPNLNMDNLAEGEFRDWILENCPFGEIEKDEGY